MCQNFKTCQQSPCKPSSRVGGGPCRKRGYRHHLIRSELNHFFNINISLKDLKTWIELYQSGEELGQSDRQFLFQEKVVVNPELEPSLIRKGLVVQQGETNIMIYLANTYIDIEVSVISVSAPAIYRYQLKWPVTSIWMLIYTLYFSTIQLY